TAEEFEHAVRQPPEGAGRIREADVAAFFGEHCADRGRELLRSRKRCSRQEGIIARVEQQRRYAYARKPWLAAGTAVVVIDAAETVKWRGDQIVELAQRARRPQARGVEQFRMCAQLGEGLAFHRGKKVPGVGE